MSINTVQYALVHSPFCGPRTWSSVAVELQRAGHHAVAVDATRSASEPGMSYWRADAEATVRSLADAPGRLLLIGHSGAGPLLPAIRQMLERPVVGYIFVDAGLPADGRTRLDLLEAELPDLAAPFRAHLEAGGVFPTWTDEDLTGILPDPVARGEMLTELHPRAQAFFDEPIPVFAGWPDAPCGYLQFSDGYDQPAGRAKALGWPYHALAGGHFHMVVEPAAVAQSLLELAGEMLRGEEHDA